MSNLVGTLWFQKGHRGNQKSKDYSNFISFIIQRYFRNYWEIKTEDEMLKKRLPYLFEAMFFYGNVGVKKLENGDWIILPVVGEDWDVYGNLLDGYMFSPWKNGYSVGDAISKKPVYRVKHNINGVIAKLTLRQTPILSFYTELINLMGTLLNEIENNLKNSRNRLYIPFLTGNAKSIIKQMEDLFERNDTPYTLLKSDLLENIKNSVETKFDFRGNDYMELFISVKNFLKETLGIKSNESSNKQERQIVDETSRNDEFSQILFGEYQFWLDQTAKDIKDFFGVNISFEKKIQEEVKQDGSNEGSSQLPNVGIDKK